MHAHAARSTLGRAAIRLLLRSVLLAVPVGLIFGFLYGNSPRAYWDSLRAAFVFTIVGQLAVAAVIHWVLPHLETADPDHVVRTLPIKIAAFTAAILLTFLASGFLLHFTILPGFMGTARQVVRVLLFSVIFGTLGIGIGFSRFFLRSYLERVRGEEAFRARVEQELRLAAEFQRALLPRARPAAGLFDTAGASLACRTIGGDFFDLVELSGGRLGFVLCDVAGKGPPAALLAAMVQGILSPETETDSGPSATLTRVNRALARRRLEPRFATASYGVLSPEGRLACSNAGHHPPIWLARDGTLRPLEKGGPPLGPFEDAVFEEETVILAPGDAVVLYSDGVTEAASPEGEFFGEERLASVLSGGRDGDAGALLQRILDTVRGFAGSEPQADDITVLVVRYVGPANR